MRNKFIQYIFLNVISSIVFTPAIAHSNELPGNIDPGRIAESITSSPEPDIESLDIPSFYRENKEASNLASNEEGDIKFILGKINLEGVTIYSNDELKKIYQKHLNQEVTLSQIYNIALEISKKYHQDGYVLSKAIIPPQEIDNGLVTIRVIEGFIENVRYEGEETKRPIVKEIIEEIIQTKPLNVLHLEKQILLLNDLPGVNARAILEPIKTGAEGAVGLIIVLSKEKVNSYIELNNGNSLYTGPYNLNLQTGLNNLLIPYSNLTTQVTTALPLNKLKFVTASYTAPITPKGLKVNVKTSIGRVKPGYKIKSLQIRSELNLSSIELTYPVLRSRHKNLYVTGEFNNKNIKTSALRNKLYHDKINVLRLSASYDSIDKFKGANSFNTKFSKGLKLGANNNSKYLSRAKGKNDFTKAEFNISRLQALSKNYSIYLGAQGQYSWSPLLSSEQFGYGGQGIGKAYDSSEIVGDHGISGMAELKYHGLDNWQLFTFYDIGKVWKLKSKRNKDDTASSIGVGARTSYKQTLNASLTIAQPLIRKINTPHYGNGKNPRVLVTLSYKF